MSGEVFDDLAAAGGVAAEGTTTPPMGIGRLQPVDLRELWPREAGDFTPWLAEKENLDVLAEELGLEFRSCEQEVDVGPFSVDLLAETISGERVILENQLGPTDHDHLGKILTYMSNLGASKAVWITADPRPEHEKTVEWLNEVTPEGVGIYLVRVRAYRIGDSRPAPHFSVVAGPVAERKRTEREARELAEREKLRYEFWQGFLERVQRFTRRFQQVGPSHDNWLEAGAGRSGFYYLLRIRIDGADVCFRVRLEPGWERKEETKRAFQAIEQYKHDIEREFGAPLEWDRREDRAVCFITYKLPLDAGLRDRERWSELWEAMGEAVARLERAIEHVAGPSLRRLRW